MPALSYSRNMSGQAESSGQQNAAPGHGSPVSCDNRFDASYVVGCPQADDTLCTDGFTIEHQISTLRQVAERHERQIEALSADKHQHCDNLANVYGQLEKVLEKLRLPSLTTLDGKAALQSSMFASSSSGSTALAGDDTTGCAVDIHADDPPWFSQKRSANEKLGELLHQHRDQVYDVLVDYRKQIDKNARETKRRLDTLERSLAHLQSDMKELHQLVRVSEEAREAEESRAKDEMRLLAKQQEAQRVALGRVADERVEKVQQCCDILSVSVAQLREETDMIKQQQEHTEKELGRQMRSIVDTEQQFAEVLERQSHSIAQLETQDSLEGAFHEVKDWLSDLEKRMVSRGELLQWTESLQQEINTRWHASGPLKSTADTSSPL
ncbi:hypothetical protein ABL78_7203 [Leptomonas seymouri]|uniref:Uncharacterized protein n=1 Tax=Leptomonas seymouri TaxID=5684 RepID=A0A0N1PBK9_LEPSE|nr:hypothetical protein ABL78_7203 [Leptomonas seymouri]|eukprot:KPI83748.1 hypothetical protein ABL78_7203 [Leptomonas seymouri]